MQSSGRVYAFGRFRLDARERVVWHGNNRVAITPKVVATLLVLLENHGRIVTKTELMERVWPDTAVEQGNLTQNIYSLRRALNGAESGVSIETIPRRGYRLTGAISLVDETQAASPESADEGAQVVRTPSVAVAAHDGRHRRRLLLPSAALLLATAGLVWVVTLDPVIENASTDPAEDPLPARVSPVESLRSKWYPALSPDGRRLPCIRHDFDGHQGFKAAAVGFVPDFIPIHCRDHGRGRGLALRRTPR